MPNRVFDLYGSYALMTTLIAIASVIGASDLVSYVEHSETSTLSSGVQP